MEDSRNSHSLIRWAGVLATGGALIFVAASCFLALALWHVALVDGYGRTYVIISPWLCAVIALASLTVLVAAALIWRRATLCTVALASRLSLGAIIATAAAWAVFGAAFLILARNGVAA